MASADAAGKPSAKSGPSRSISLPERLARVPLFFLFLAYVQAGSFVALALLLVGSLWHHASFAEHLLSVTRTRFAHSRKSKPLHDDTTKPVAYLCNHRCWGDFWVEAAISGGASFVSRREVAVAIPVTALWGYLQGWTWFFNRSAKHKEGWVKWMSGFFSECHAKFSGKGLILYPEGTRSTKPLGNPIKEGSLRSIYGLGWTVQVVITTDKEFLMHEGSCWLGIGEQLVTSVGDPIFPQDYKTGDEFVEAVKASWTSTWADAYAAKQSQDYVARPAALLPGAVKRVGGYGGPRVMRARVVAAVLLLVAAYFKL